MKQIFITLFLVLTTSFLFGQTKKVENVNITSSTVVFLGKSEPIKDLVAKKATSKEKKDKFKKDKKKPDNFRNRSEVHSVAFPELEHQGVDPVWQSTHPTSSKRSVSEPLHNFDGMTAGSPNDPTLAVGINYVLQSINATRVRVWDKEGNVVNSFNMNTLWSEFGANSAGDPIVLFDQEAERWILTEFTDPANLLIGVSETSDPLGSYFAYNFSTPNFPDYPKYGIWTDHLVVTTNEQGPGSLHQYFIEREALLNGADARMQRVTVNGTSGSEQGFVTSTPIDWEGQTRPEDSRPIVVKLNDSSWGEIGSDAIELFRFNINYDNVNETEVESILVETTPYDGYPCAAATGGFACVPQPNGNGLDAVPEVIMHVPQYRNFGTHESIVLSFVTDVTNGSNHAGVRWMEMRKSDGSDWSSYQEGSYAPDEHHRFLSGVAMDKNGNIGLAYNISSETLFAGIRYTGRFSSDPLGEMTIPEVSVIEGNSTLNSFGRFADYSHITVDPVDETTFWFTSEYAAGGSTNTRIVAFEFAPDTFDMAITTILNPESGFELTADEVVEVEVFNAGINTADSYDVILSLEGQELETLTITDPLASRESRLHTFNNTIDMSVVGDYNLSVSVVSPDDQNLNNNTINKTVSQWTEINAWIEVSGPPASCNIASILDITIGNQGGLTLTDATINFYLDGTLIDTDEWTGNLEFGEAETYQFLLTDIPQGQNDYEIEIIHGGGEDLLPDNNTTNYSINSIGPAGLLTLTLNLDEYPQETAWFIYEEGASDPIFQGGSYNEQFFTYQEEVCLDPNACYTFEITDSYGDGICCGFGEGSYGLYNSEGNPIFTSNGEFGESQVTNFCVSDVECLITAEVQVVDVGLDGSLGSIMITPTSGIAPFTYSLDGGMTSQESNIFDNLPAADYVVTISSGDGSCTEDIAATVGIVSSIEENLINEVIIKSTPNPNDGFFDLSIENHQSNEVFVKFNIYDAQGRMVQSRKMANYSGVYKTQVSLLEYASGTYFIRFLDKDLDQLIKVIKL